MGAAAAAVVAGVAGVAFLYPLATAVPLTPQQWERRILFEHCGADAPRVPTPKTEPAPDGGCWI